MDYPWQWFELEDIQSRASNLTEPIAATRDFSSTMDRAGVDEEWLWDFIFASYPH